MVLGHCTLKRIVDPSSSGASASSIFTPGIVLGNSDIRTSCRSRIVLAFVYGRSFRHRRQGLARQPPLHQPGEETCEGRDILADTRFFESVHVGVAVGYRNDRPRVSTRRHHRVHQEAPDAAVAIHIRMSIVIVGGLISDLLMSIVLLPTLYVWIARSDDRLPEADPNDVV